MKTIFKPTLLDFAKWAKEMIEFIKQENRVEVLDRMKKLADVLEVAQRELLRNCTNAKRGDAHVFPADGLHAGPGSKAHSANASSDAHHQDFPRVTSYFQFVPAALFEDKEWEPLLHSMYSAEHVLDRRTMVCPNQLKRMLALHGVDPILVDRAETWLSTGSEPLCEGRVNRMYIVYCERYNNLL
jgi:hypothetical protein